MPDVKKVIHDLEQCLDDSIAAVVPADTVRDALALLKAQEPVQPNGEQYQCNKCKFYQGVHNVMGHAPCSFWNIGGVLWNDYCSRFYDFR